MKVVLLRVGIDTGSGGIHGPLFKDGSFEFIPIPDGHHIDPRTYGETAGRYGRPFIDYFPKRRRQKMKTQAMHVDPEFDTWTYGDPTRPKASLRKLDPGDLLVFYCGLQGCGFNAEPALYLVAYLDVQAAGRASEFSQSELHDLFGANFHVRHQSVFEEQKDSLVLVKGSTRSRRLNKAVHISAVGQDRRGRPLKILSPQMREVFGDFGGKNSIQRSSPRWVKPDFVEKAAAFVKSLE